MIASLPELEEKERLEAIGCSVTLTPFERRGMNPMKDLALRRAYRRLVEQLRPRAVLTYTIKPNAYGGEVCAKHGIPYFANVTGLGSALEGGGVVGAVAVTLLKIGLKRARRVFAQNEYIRTFLLEKGIATADQLCLLPGSGVNLRAFAATPMPEKPGFLFISRVMREKGIEEFLAAAEALKAEWPEATFTVLGACEEDYTERLRSLAARGVIAYPGKVPDVRPYLEASQCLVHPSFYSEGMSNVCLEAAASARAVVTTDHPGCRETVTDGVSGFLVPTRDASAVTAALRRFLALSHDEKEAMGRAGRRLMEERFDRRIVVEKYLEALGSL